MQSLSLYPDEDDDLFWAEHAYVRLRPATRLPVEPEEIILGNRIWFGSVESQDDIFEGAPPFVADPNLLDLEEIRRLAARWMAKASPEEVEVFADRMFTELSNPRIFTERTGLMIERYTAMFRRSSILSLFRDPRIQRNWSEYATHGTGFGAIFDFREPWPLESAPDLNIQAVPFLVSYVPADEPPIIKIRVAPVSPDEGFDDIQTALLTKSDEWGSQYEERLFRVGIGPGSVEFPAASLRAMLVGYASSERTEGLILDLCRSRPIAIPVFRVEPAPPSRRLALRRIG